MEDHITTDLVDFDKSGNTLYMLDSRGRNTAALVTVDLKTKKSTVVLDDGAADIEFLLVHPTNKTIQAAEADYDRTLRQAVLDRLLRDRRRRGHRNSIALARRQALGRGVRD